MGWGWGSGIAFLMECQLQQSNATRPISEFKTMEDFDTIFAWTSFFFSAVTVAELLWTDPGLKSGSSVRELISTLKRKKSLGGE